MTLDAEMAKCKRVLIVDDDTHVLFMLHHLLERSGFTVVGEAVSASEAAQVAADVEPSIVLLDYMMPGADGSVAAEQIRRDVPRAQVVCFSAVLDSAPEWADSHVKKIDVGELPDVLNDLAASRSRKAIRGNSSKDWPELMSRRDS